MDSSSTSSSLSRHRHASSISSSSSVASETSPPPPHRRLTLTIPPLRIKPLNANLNAQRPPHSSQTSTEVHLDTAGQTRPKIKLKANKASLKPETPVTDSPAPGPSVGVPPSAPPKPPRSVKLKPLKEVLTKLLLQIKRKDDYGFFLQPVDASQIPAYADIIKNPMDFGTMTTKVEKGRYRTLDDFTTDFRLVISNTQTFNPLESLYYTEAARIEHYGLEQIAKAAAQVIEFETDWTIDVEANATQDAIRTQETEAEMNSPTNVLGGSEARRDANESVSRRRSPSVSSSAQGIAAVPLAEKSKRSRKKVPMVTESWEPGGRLPGTSNGLGSFPSGSDLARLMLQLKLRGKVFRSKKEKMRIERAGVPYYSDGSMAISLMERPFVQFSKLVPDRPSAPRLTPVIYTQSTLFDNPDEPASRATTSQPPEENHTVEVVYSAGPVALPIDTLSRIVDDGGPLTTHFTLATKPGTQKRFRHWNVSRYVNNRSRAREIDDLDERPVKRQKLPDSTDYGSFSTLLGTIAVEQGIKVADFERILGSNERQSDTMRLDLQVLHPSASTEEIFRLNSPFDAEEYIRDVVYGGLDGLAYLRSVAEFCTTEMSEETNNKEFHNALGKPLFDWVETHVVDSMTHGNHMLLRMASHALLSSPTDITVPGLDSYIALAKADKSHLRSWIADLHTLTSSEAQVDIASLLKSPYELFAAETEWAGSSYKTKGEHEKDRRDTALAKTNSTEYLAFAIESHRQGKEDDIIDSRDIRPSDDRRPSLPMTQSDTREVVEHALDAGVRNLMDLDRRVREGESFGSTSTDTIEDSTMRRTRLNLIAVAKRAPIDKIARLPADLVPPHIRHIVPTFPS